MYFALHDLANHRVMAKVLAQLICAPRSKIQLPYSLYAVVTVGCCVSMSVAECCCLGLCKPQQALQQADLVQ